MAFPVSPSAAFPAIAGSPMGMPSQVATGPIMSGTMNWEPVRQRLLGPDLEDALAAATELREGIEIVHTVEFPLMLSALLPAFSTILAHRTNPSPDKSTVEHKLRNVVLEIISRMPSNEILRPHAPHLVAVALDILNRDYEENALLASRIIFDLYKVYRTLPQDYVQPYLDFVLNSYRALPTSVQRNFSFNALVVAPAAETPSGPTSSSDPKASDATSTAQEQSETSTNDNNQNPGPLPSTPASNGNTAGATTTPPGPSMTSSPSLSRIPSTPTPQLSPPSSSSFRVLTEFPLTVMLMFQLYPKFLRNNIPSLITVMMEGLALRAPSLQVVTQGTQPLDDNAKRLYFSRCQELVAAQAKTLSFLTYLLRGFSNDLKPHEDRLATNVVALMSTCPREFISTRKELLVATRHLLNSDFRNGFFRHVDSLLDERVLMGSHHRYAEQTVLRPLGYTTLSDLVHHVKAKLNLNQISKVVSIFSRVLHDTSMVLPMSTQYTAVRTLLSVVDIVFNNKDRNPQIGRDILVRILKTLGDKLEALQACRDQVEKVKNGQGLHHDESHAGLSDLAIIAQLESPVGSDAKESLRDLKSMVRAIIVGHKTLIWYINKYRGQREKDKIEAPPLQPGTNEEISSAMLKITHTEQALIDRYIRLAFPCMKWLKDETSNDTTNGANATKPSVDHFRDALSYFAAAFTVLDGYDLCRTLGRRLEELMEAVTDDPAAILVPRHLLAANATTSFEFCTLLLNFLVERMDMLATSVHVGVQFVPPANSCDVNEAERLQELMDSTSILGSKEDMMKRSSAHLQLFERVLKSLSSFPENERALRPHLRRIVSKCLQASMEKDDFKVDNHCMLLRYIFRSISAGKFEESYRELLPLIPTVLNGLFRIFRATDDPFLHHTIIELLLTIPARLSSLLPHMNILLRVIISALESQSGDLVNLGLRTLEFWVDNLNPEFLFPEISKQSELFVSLMKALSTHLRPAPYPYGLLTLRLLGKLGGKNRRVLREPMDIKDPASFKVHARSLRIPFSWSTEHESMETDPPLEEGQTQGETKGNYTLPLSIESCVELIKRILLLSEMEKDVEPGNKATTESAILWKDSEKLWDIPIEETDLMPYCLDVMRLTQKDQVESALAILRVALNEMIAVEDFDLETLDVSASVPETSREKAPQEEEAISRSCVPDSFSRRGSDKDFELVSFGLMLSCAIESISESAIRFAKGLLTHTFVVVISHQSCFIRIDANGSRIGSEDDGVEELGSAEFFEDGLGSLKPFGYFEQAGSLHGCTNPLIVNRSLAELLAQPSARAREIGLDMMHHLLNLTESLNLNLADANHQNPNEINRGALVFFESLLSALCEKCIVTKWNRRDGLHSGICLVLQKMGKSWSRKYEIEVMNVALFALKSVPREMSMASVKAFEFVVRVCEAMYGQAKVLYEGGFVFDALASKPELKEHTDNEIEDPSNTTPMDKTSTEHDEKESSLCHPCEEVLQILITEMSSTKNILRIASRYIIKHYVVEVMSHEKCLELFNGHIALIKRVLFSRSLRLLPLPEQVGVVEALAMLVDQLPTLIPLNDQHLLAFLSELLKMSSVADGEMTDPNLCGNIVDKDGFVVPTHEPSAAAKSDSKIPSGEKPSSALFLRRDCILSTVGAKVFIPQECATGVQLRNASILLLRAVIRGHSNPFFDAEGSTPIGNIRPHVISLLFRSLASVPIQCVNAAHDALRDVLTLSVVSDGGKSKSRLRKELLQTCIRPVLLNLRDYTRLSVYLLRGLSRLLSLLSSWFNKTLGEKLLDHLQKWTDPGRMKSQKIWHEGEEPDVAAAIIDLFVLLPHASHFVEPLVKTTIKLEACLPAFQSRYTLSPYRKPLARYLNKHSQNTIAFFLQRLKTPLYSEIFQDVIALPESSSLREYLARRESSVSLLNVCFERPLGIIRSEKAASTTPSPGGYPTNPSGQQSMKELFSLHGIHPFTASPTQKEISLKQDVESKKKKLQILQQELNRAKEIVGKTSQAGSNAPSTEIEEAKKKLKMAKAAVDRGTKDLNDSRQKYATEMAQIKATHAPQVQDNQTRPMTIEALELQHQGFLLVKTLIVNDRGYFGEHNDVLRAFRWLWRSKGRYLRLQHEDSVPPRYHDESKLLATILVDYSESSPSDVDLLFELIRIFLQPGSCDFSFVRYSLSAAVTNLSLEQKKQILQRFFALLSGESSEEIKTLSLQLVVYPMLQTFFKERQTIPNKLTTAGGKSSPQVTDIIDAATARRFVIEVLFNNDKPIHCGDRLKVELLKMTNILIEFVPEQMEAFGKEIVKFCLSFLKSDDASCKSWAYLVLCRHISATHSGTNLILQVYSALIRAHQPEGKDIIRAALDLLIPAMENRLTESEKKKATEFTNRIMFEEVNSVPQLAHIWAMVVSHSMRYYGNRHHFVRHMINSLTRLGLPPNAPPENRSLSVSVVELVLLWHRMQEDENDGISDIGQPKRKIQRTESADSSEENVNKKVKAPMSGMSTPEKNLPERSPLLDQAMVDTLVNFVVRLKILLADPKLDIGLSDVSQRIDPLLTSIMTDWPNCHIQEVYLEKVVSMCREYNLEVDSLSNEKRQGRKPMGKSKVPSKSKSSSSNQTTTGAKSDDSRPLTSSLLSACLDVFATLSRCAPNNTFLTANASQLNEILTSCFYFSRRHDETELRLKLKMLVVYVLSLEQAKSRMDVRVIRRLNVLVERFLSDSEKEYGRKQSENASPEESTNHGNMGPRSPPVPGEDNILDDGAVYFAVQIVKEVNAIKISYFKSFASVLIALLSTIVKKHTTAASTKQKHGGVSFVPQAGTSTIRQMYHTPTSGILAESSTETTSPGSSGIRPSPAKDSFPSKILKEFDQGLGAAVMILEIIGGSDVAYSFTPLRKTLFQTLSLILDSSNNVQLLMAAVRLVGRWLSESSNGPLTLKERNSFLWKIASFDFNGMPDVVSQPLADLVAQFVILLLEGTSHRRVFEVPNMKLSTATPRFGDSDEMLIGRSLVACLLTSNNSLRELLLSHFVSRVVLGSGDSPSRISATEAIPRRTPAALLWQLFHSDFEGLGGRNWIVLFVEILLCSACFLPNTWSRHGRLPAPLARTDSKKSWTLNSADFKMFSESMDAVKKDMASGAYGFRLSLSRLAHGDHALAHALFELLFPEAWNSITSDAVRFKLAAPIESLLSRSYHSQFLKYGTISDLSYPTNAVRSFLNGLGSLSPMPVLDVDLLVSLAESYTCWYEVLSILEDQFVMLSCKNLSKSGDSLRDKILLAMRHCYKELGESNIALTLSLIPCKLPQSYRAASLAVHGEIDKALEEYTGLVEFVESSHDLALSDFEEKLIEDMWVNLNRELCQTSVISEYANTANVPHLMLDSAWKQREWDQVRGLCSSPALVAAVESGDVSVKMCETLLAVADGKLSDVENLHAQTAQLCLYKWQLLPSLSHASLAHASLLHLFHRLVEIRESGQIMVETGNHSTGKTLPDLKNLLNAWRHRLPNDYEELVIWDEIFTWRSHMFSAITSNFSWSEPSTLATLHDRPWTTIRMAMAARKQGMKQTSLLILNKITDSRAMDVSDAFFKLREQVMAYNNADNELERTGGLNLINTTNLSFFDAAQKSELFRLKAMFLSSLRRTSKSNQAYCHSVQICPSHAKAWTSWGGLCSSLGTLTEKQAEQIAGKGGNAPDNIKESKAAAAKKVAQYLAQAMGCYIEAVQIEATEKNRIHLPKCLWLLTKDGHTPGVLCQTLESRGTKLPPWVWLPWIPQLLTGLCRNEGQAIKSLLSRVVKAYPQAVYYSLRAFYLERRDVERAKGISAASSPHMPSVAYAEEMMSTLRRSHASLWSSLEAILEELIVKFRPSYEEELLATISALLERAEAHLEKQSLPDKARLEDEEAMVASWSKTLSRIASKFFRSMDDSAVASSRRDERVKKTTEFKRKYKDEFEKDFQVNGSEAPESPALSESKPQFKLTEYITRLQKWKAKLESQVACTPASLPLIESSHALAMYAGESPDLWPGACDTKYLTAGSDTNQEDDEDQSRHQSTTSSAAIARKAAFNAALAAAKAAAREGVGGEYGGGSAAIEIPGQYCPNSSTTADIKPCPELHVKLQRFEPVVEVLKRNDQLIRRISMVGSDGRVYRFLLQFAIPYWTRTDERTSQTNFIIDKFLRQNNVTARNHLSVQPSAAIPVAQRLRMTLDVESRVALDDVFRWNDSADDIGQDLASLPTYFLQQVDEKLASSTTAETSQEEKEKLEKQIRCQVYNDIVQTKVDPKVFLRFVQTQLDGPENLFHFRRALAGQLASNSLLQYIFSVVERTPPRFVFLMSKALVMSPDFRVSYSNQGFIEGHDIPFRMTPNIEALIGKTYLDGRFIRSIAMVAGAIREHREEFDPILRLLMRDDILAWYSKSLAKTDSKTQELERQLMERVSKNVSVLHARFSECAPTSTKASKEGSIDSRIRELYDAATNAENLSMMPTNYHAWL